MEMHNTGGGGMETADKIAPQVNEWLSRKGKDEKPFFMWLNVWDPHTPYRTPKDFQKPFKDKPLPAWYTEDVRKDHWGRSGPHSAQEVNGWQPRPDWMYENENLKENYPSIAELQPTEISSMDEARKMIDGYDMGVSYAGRYVGAIVQQLKDKQNKKRVLNRISSCCCTMIHKFIHLAQE